MKIRVNYELMDKIRESKTGISLKRSINKNLLVISIATLLNSLQIINSVNPVQEFTKSLLVIVPLSLIYRGMENVNFKELNKDFSIQQLKYLSKLLREHYINTDYELLQKAYEYETKYSFMLDEDKIPRLKQEKYIMVPVVDRDGEKEVSLVQEHLIGSKDYELSYGSPKKVLKPAVSFNY